MDNEFCCVDEVLGQFFPGGCSLAAAAAAPPAAQQQHFDDDNNNKWRWCKEAADKLILEQTVRFKEDGFGVQFHPLFSYGTASVWGECALDELTRAYWEVAVDEVYGSSMMFGIGTRDALQTVPFGFVDLLGGVGRLGDQAYGLSHKGSIFHAGTSTPFCERLRSMDGPCTCTVGILFDGPSARIGFSLDGKWLGWAFQTVKLAGRVYFPMVSSTAQRSYFTLLQHRQRQTRSPNTLQQQCMDAMVEQMLRARGTELPSLGKFGLPKGMECELWHKWCKRVMHGRSPPVERNASTQTEEGDPKSAEPPHSPRKRKCPPARGVRHASGDLGPPAANPLQKMPRHYYIAQ
uniref:B30.2/SPRY domain-containing protein n=1 Tax=Globodera rostochiensis TaxID=31243 RepID=A0A914GWN1_GLORO